MQSQDKFIQTGQATDESSSKTTGDTKPVIWNEAIKICGDEDVFCAVMKSFMDDAPDIFQHLEQAIAQKDCSQIALYAHRLKSSARNIGAVNLSSAALKLETIAKEKNLQTLIQDYAELKKLYTQLENFIACDTWLDQLKNEVIEAQHD